MIVVVNLFIESVTIKLYKGYFMILDMFSAVSHYNTMAKNIVNHTRVYLHIEIKALVTTSHHSN